MNFTTSKLIKSAAAALSLLAVAGASEARTVVVHLSEYDTDKTTNALLFAKHSCQFLEDAEQVTYRILLTNDAALLAVKNLKHPKSRATTLPDDDPKNGNHLMRQLLSLKASNPSLRCNVEVAVTGPGLAKTGRTLADIYPGIRVGGAKPTNDPNKVQVPAYVTIPAVAGDPVVVIDW